MTGKPNEMLLAAIASTYSSRHKSINTHFDNLLAALNSPSSEKADMTGSEAMFEIGRLSLLNLNSIAESMSVIAAAITLKPSAE